MLEEIFDQHSKEVLFRFASHRPDSEFLRGQGMGPEQISEMKEFLESRGMSVSPEKLVDSLFEPKRRLNDFIGAKTRFSDGSFPVGYFSLESETAEAEVRYWLREKFAGKPSGGRTVWYSRFICDFWGRTKDLRPMQTMWPDLMHGNDYAFCKRLGSEAVHAGLDGLLAPSVRRSDGTNVPVFARRALGNPRNHSLIRIQCNVSHDTTGNRSTPANASVPS